jgi:hypothetical protein
MLLSSSCFASSSFILPHQHSQRSRRSQSKQNLLSNGGLVGVVVVVGLLSSQSAAPSSPKMLLRRFPPPLDCQMCSSPPPPNLPQNFHRILDPCLIVNSSSTDNNSLPSTIVLFMCVSRVGPGRRVIFSPVELHKNNQQMEGEANEESRWASAISRNAKVPDRKSQKETVMYCAL